MEAKIIRLYYGALINLMLCLLGIRGLNLQEEAFLINVCTTAWIGVIASWVLKRLTEAKMRTFDPGSATFLFHPLQIKQSD